MYLPTYLPIFIFFKYFALALRREFSVLDSWDSCFWVCEKWCFDLQVCRNFTGVAQFKEDLWSWTRNSDVSSIQALIGKYWKKFQAIKKISFWAFFFPFFFIFFFMSAVYKHLFGKVYWLCRHLYWYNTSVSCLDILWEVSRKLLSCLFSLSLISWVPV